MADTAAPEAPETLVYDDETTFVRVEDGWRFRHKGRLSGIVLPPVSVEILRTFYDFAMRQYDAGERIGRQEAKEEVAAELIALAKRLGPPKA